MVEVESIVVTQGRRPRLIKLPEVVARTGLSRSEIYRRCREAGPFPRPVKIGVRSVVWSDLEVDGYVQACIAQRDAMRSGK